MGMKNTPDDEDNLLKRNIAEFEKHIIVSALRRTGGNQSEAARQLGTTKRVLTYRIHKYGIDISAFQFTNHRPGGRNESHD